MNISKVRHYITADFDKPWLSEFMPVPAPPPSEIRPTVIPLHLCTMFWNVEHLHRNGWSIKSWMKGKGMCYGNGHGWKRGDERIEAGGVKGGAGASLSGWTSGAARCLLCGLAIQRRRLSTSSRFTLTTINGIFLLSHSIRFLSPCFSWTVLQRHFQ